MRGIRHPSDTACRRPPLRQIARVLFRQQTSRTATARCSASWCGNPLWTGQHLDTFPLIMQCVCSSRSQIHCTEVLVLVCRAIASSREGSACHGSHGKLPAQGGAGALRAGV